jgi:hypothetical protein
VLGQEYSEMVCCWRYGRLVIVSVAPRCMGTWGNGVDVGHVGLESDIRPGFGDMYCRRE